MIPKPAGLRTLRLLAQSLQAFERLNRARLRPLGLTTAQFDILATLGNTEGMTFHELGERTLITKGTLTGVVDRMAAAGLVSRQAGQTDRRTIVVLLTPSGQALFEQVFPVMLAVVGEAFAEFGSDELRALEGSLARLRQAFDSVATVGQQGGGRGIGQSSVVTNPMAGPE